MFKLTALQKSKLQIQHTRLKQQQAKVLAEQRLKSPAGQAKLASQAQKLAEAKQPTN